MEQNKFQFVNKLFIGVILSNSLIQWAKPLICTDPVLNSLVWLRLLVKYDIVLMILNNNIVQETFLIFIDVEYICAT